MLDILTRAPARIRTRTRTDRIQRNIQWRLQQERIVYLAQILDILTRAPARIRTM